MYDGANWKMRILARHERLVMRDTAIAGGVRTGVWLTVGSGVPSSPPVTLQGGGHLLVQILRITDGSGLLLSSC